MWNPLAIIKKKRMKWKYYRALNSAIFLFMRMDSVMKECKWPAYRVKQFWRSFIKSPRSREKVFRELFEGINKE